MGLFRCITIGAACAALCLNAAAGPDDIVWTLRNSTDSGPRTSTPTHPTTCFGIPAYNYLTLLPVYFCPGTGLTLSVGTPGTIAIDTPSSGNASSTQIVNGADTRLTNARSTASTLITDSTSIGRQVLTATDAAAVRSFIGVSSSGFDGAYNSLTGIPSTFAPSAHTHPVSQISDSTTTGQALVTAANTSTARTTLGLGTSAVLDVPASGDATSSQVVKGSDGRLSDARTPLAHNQAWSTITGTPTTISGYGITDGVTSTAMSSALTGYVSSSTMTSTLSNYVTSSAMSSTLAGYPTSSSLSSTLSGYVTSADMGTTLSGYATTSGLSSGLAAKLSTPTGTTSQFLDGTGTPKSFATTLSGYGITDAYPLTGNPSGFLTSVSSGAITSALGYTPYNGSTNPSGFLTGVSSGQISTALGYTPYNGSTNPSGFLTGITGSQVTTALGFTPYNGSTNPNGYLSSITSGQVTTALGYTPASSASLSGYVPTTRTVNGHALSADVTVTKADVGLGSVTNVDTTNAGNIASGTLAVGRLPTAIDAANIADGSVSNTEFQALDGVTSAVQTQINGKFAIPTGTTSQVVLGNGSLGTLPVVPTVVSAFTNDASYATTTALSSGLAGKLSTPSGTTSQVVLGNGTLGALPVVPTTVSTFTNDAGYTTTTALNAGLATKLTIPAGTTSQVVLGNGTLGTLPVIPTAVSSFTNDAGYSTTSALTAGLAGKLNTPTGTASQCVRGDGSIGTCPGGTVTSVGVTSSDLTVTGSPVTGSGSITLALPNTGTAGTYSLVTTDAKGRVTSGTNMSINDAPARSLVTSTNATGFQISATRNARVCYEGTVSTTSTIGGPASATVFLETAATNSTTPGDWTVKARQTYSNNITLAVVLNQVQLNNWSMCRDIPAGLYVRVRSGSITGTASVSINSEQQESTY